MEAKGTERLLTDVSGHRLRKIVAIYVELLRERHTLQITQVCTTEGFFELM